MDIELAKYSSDQLKKVCRASHRVIPLLHPKKIPDCVALDLNVFFISFLGCTLYFYYFYCYQLHSLTDVSILDAMQ